MKIVPLASLPAGARGRIVSIDAGPGLVRRLAQMGFFPGAEVEVVVNEGKGLLVVRVRGSEIAISKGIAMKILVEIL